MQSIVRLSYLNSSSPSMNDTMTTFEIDYWVSEYPELDIDEIIDLLNAIAKDSQEEND